MSRKHYAALFAAGIFIALLVSSFQTSPGYMDADYYLSTGKNLADGLGFTEQVLWNYLDNPQGLPHPSHTYWMPLTSIVAATGLWMARSLGTFSAGRILFILAAALIPVGTTRLAYQLTENKNTAAFAGLLPLAPGFYLPFWTTIDSFALLMLMGACFFMLVHHLRSSPLKKSQTFLLGLTAGLMHLARADGVIWLVAAFSVVFKQEKNIEKNTKWLNFVLLLAGYLAVMGPWFVRNFLLFSAPLAPGSIQTLWLTNYDEFFSFPASMLTAERWLASGLSEIIQDRVSALSLNLQNFVFVQGLILLTPLIFLGGWALRRENTVKAGLLAWTLILLVMTVVFPYSGQRGGFFHSGAALQPLLWVLASVGLDRFVGWGAEKRGWNANQARKFFQSGVLLIAAALTAFVFWSRVIGPDSGDPIWGRQERLYQELETALQSSGAKAGEIVLVNNPPGYYLVSGRPAIVIPDGDETRLFAAAAQFGARYLILEHDHPDGLDGLFENPKDYPGLNYLETVNGARLFFIP